MCIQLVPIKCLHLQTVITMIICVILGWEGPIDLATQLGGFVSYNLEF